MAKANYLVMPEIIGYMSSSKEVPNKGDNSIVMSGHKCEQDV